MSTLILDRNLLESEQGNPTYTLAQARTATVMTRLDAAHNRSVVRFLSDSGLADTLLKEIALDGADLSGADLSDADLKKADLSKADLDGAVSWTAEQLAEAQSLKGATIPTGQKTPLAALPALPLKSGRERLEPRREYVVTDKYAFEPAFRFKLGSSKFWHCWSQPDKAEEITLVKTVPEGGFLIFSRPRYVFDPSNPSELKEVPAPRDVDEWVSWFQSHPNLETSTPVSLKVGGAPGVQIEITTSSTPKNYPQDLWAEMPCVPLYPIGEPNIIASYERTKRFVIVDVRDETVVINVSAQAGKYNEFPANAQNVLDTVKWETAQAPSTADDEESGGPS